MNDRVIPLVLAKENSEYEIIGIRGGCGLRAKLLEMGFIPGSKVKLLSNSNGPLIVAINSSRYTMCKGFASKILIKEVV
ncbi:FeoA family protein [Thermodesulfobium narugense]|uniref:FeoA family protein n=1 Tax=Thermodesulfobium narugense TaxID=184064 RepID=UPI0002FD888C|nr:FeoA domain-containing protein [Thermodesulfobium narugense]